MGRTTDDVVDEDPLEEGEVEGTPSAPRSGLLEDDLEFAPIDDSLCNPEVEELAQKKFKKAKKNKEVVPDVSNEEVDVSKAPAEKQNTRRKRKSKKVATTSVENEDTKSIPTEVMPNTPSNTTLVHGDGKGSLSLALEGAHSQGQKKVDKKKNKSEATKLHLGDDGL